MSRSPMEVVDFGLSPITPGELSTPSTGVFDFTPDGVARVLASHNELFEGAASK